MIFIRTFGCGENYFKSQTISQDLIKYGFKVYNQPIGSDIEFIRNKKESYFIRKSDFLIINTCTISEDSEVIYQVGFIKYCRGLNKNLKIIITGCSVKNKFSIINRLDIPGSILIKEITSLGDFIKSKLKKESYRKLDVNCDFEDKRYYILLKEGCSRYCSYCACSHNVTTKSKNTPLKKILKQIEHAKENSFSRIELAGSCMGRWHDVNDPNFNFCDLIELLLKDTNFKIGSFELHPLDFSVNLMKLLSNHQIDKNDEFSIPIQSASDRILKMMNRGYDQKYLFKLFNDIYSFAPQIRISTDIIIGFPTETINDLQMTVAFLEYFPFCRISIYPYSLREGTPASDFKNLTKNKLKKHYNFLWNIMKSRDNCKFLFSLEEISKSYEKTRYKARALVNNFARGRSK